MKLWGTPRITSADISSCLLVTVLLIYTRNTFGFMIHRILTKITRTNDIVTCVISCWWWKFWCIFKYYVCLAMLPCAVMWPYCRVNHVLRFNFTRWILTTCARTHPQTHNAGDRHACQPGWRVLGCFTSPSPTRRVWERGEGNDDCLSTRQPADSTTC